LPFFEKAITYVHPQQMSALNEYGTIVSNNLGRFVKALDLFTRALQLAPMDTTELKNLSITYGNLGDPAKAQMTYERYLQVRQQLLSQQQH
jgi:Flp pilus assembly protein TadD